MHACMQQNERACIQLQKCERDQQSIIINISFSVEISPLRSPAFCVPWQHIIFKGREKKSKHISIRFHFHFHYLSWLELMGAHFNSVVDCRTTIAVYARLCLATLTQMNGQFPVVIAQLNLYLECIYDCVCN